MENTEQLPGDINQRLRQLDLLERVSRIRLACSDIETFLGQFLELVLEEFRADRAWVFFPCDPDAPSWSVPIERTRPEWPGAFALGQEIPMQPDVAETLRHTLAAKGAVCFGSPGAAALPAVVAERFAVKSQVQIVLRPGIGKPWMLGMHHCAAPNPNAPHDIALFEVIADRVSDIFSSLISLRQLQDSEARLRLAQTGGGIGSWEADLQTQKQQWSESCVDLLGFPPLSQPTWQDFLHAVHPDDRQRVIDAMDAHIARGVRYAPEYRIILANGDIRHMRSCGQVECDASGKPVKMRGIVQDITDQRQAEAYLRVAAVAFECQQAMLITDANDVIVQVNPAFTELTGYTAEEAIGCTPRLIRSGRHDLRFYAEMWQTIGAGDVWQGEVWDRHKSGTVFPAWLNISPVRDLHGAITHYVGAYSDISQRKAIEAAELARKKAEAANQAKTEFLGSMSHELRTPLNSILGFTQLLMSHNGLDTDARHMTGEIERAGQHLMALVNDVIDLARIESGRMELVIEPVTVGPLIQEAIGMVEPMAGQAGISLTAEACDCHAQTISADQNRLRQVLVNFLSNAVKYNRRGGWIRLDCEKRDTVMRITVSDNGFGIAPSKQDRVFAAFDRLGAECSEVEGTGIGLNISKRVTEAMGGLIGFSSTEGQGSRFWVEFPLAGAFRTAPGKDAVLVEVSAGNAGPLSLATGSTSGHAVDATLVPGANPGADPSGKPVAESADGFRNAVVLYIEDNPMNIRLMGKIFAKMPGIELRHAQNAEKGLEMARHLTPNLILLDINLPDLDGYATLRQLRQGGADCWHPRHGDHRQRNAGRSRARPEGRVCRVPHQAAQHCPVSRRRRTGAGLASQSNPSPGIC